MAISEFKPAISPTPLVDRSHATSWLAPPNVPSDREELLQCLDATYETLRTYPLNPVPLRPLIDPIAMGLKTLRDASSKQKWLELLEHGRTHPIVKYLHEDPFTARAFHKPRGYAGDAVMMDYIYGRDEVWPRPEANLLGDALFEYTTAGPASLAVRERRYRIADILDSTARAGFGRHILSVASGHLREASLSTAIRRQQFGRFVALDADVASLAEVERCYGRFGVESVASNVRELLSGKFDLGRFDLIYSTGLYDYLTDATAKRLTVNLFDRLRPGGRLVIGNFLPNIRDIGYMEMFMDWHLIYRSPSEMLGLTALIASSAIEEYRLWAEKNDNVVLIELVKR